MKAPPLKWSIPLLAVVAALWLLRSGVFDMMPKPPDYMTEGTKDDQMVLRDGVRKVLDEMLSDGSVKLTSEDSKAQVEPLIWVGLDADEKAQLGRALAIYMAEQRGNKKYRAEIYDKQSGRKLAKWTKKNGLEVL